LPTLPAVFRVSFFTYIAEFAAVLSCVWGDGVHCCLHRWCRSVSAVGSSNVLLEVLWILLLVPGCDVIVCCGVGVATVCGVSSCHFVEYGGVDVDVAVETMFSSWFR